MSVRETTFVTSCFIIPQVPSEKGVNSIRKEFGPYGSKFFTYWVDPFSEENQYTLKPLYNTVRYNTVSDK